MNLIYPLRIREMLNLSHLQLNANFKIQGKISKILCCLTHNLNINILKISKNYNTRMKRKILNGYILDILSIIPIIKFINTNYTIPVLNGLVRKFKFFWYYDT